MSDDPDEITPFPGMNPYLEGPVNWSDFHATFIGALREAINTRLPRPYYARIEQWVMMIPVDDDQAQRREPDVLVGYGGRTAGSRPPSPPAAGSAVGLLEPAAMANVAQSDPHREWLIEILRMPERDVVTVLELFSPTNKRGEGRGIYLEKRRQLLATPANVVEIDLIRAGRRLQLNKRLPPDDYYAFVSRGDRRPACDVYHWSVRDPLPTLPIPLRPPDADVLVGLADPFRVAFARGRYGRFVDYADPPPPPAFDADTAAWVRSVAGPDAPGTE